MANDFYFIISEVIHVSWLLICAVIITLIIIDFIIPFIVIVIIIIIITIIIITYSSFLFICAGIFFSSFCLLLLLLLKLYDPQREESYVQTCAQQTQVSLHIRVVWSESSLSAWRNLDWLQSLVTK